MHIGYQRLVSGAVAVAFGLVAVRSQGAAKYTKKESEIQATQTSLTKPAQAKKDEKKRPEINADDVFGGVGEKVKGVTDQQINILKKLIANTSDGDPEKPDLLFRLAELYAEQQRYYNFRARDLDAKIFAVGNEGKTDEVAKLKKQQADFTKLEGVWLLESVKKYLEVADGEKYQTYKKMDEVLFYLAYLLTQVKKEEKARQYFKRLIKDYPKSRFIPDALLSFAEFFFEDKRLEDALKFYEKVLQYPESRVYGYAKYKEGWVYYNLGDFKQALATFVEVVNMKSNDPKKNKNMLALQKEAKKDIVRTYARLPGANPEKAWPFFQRTGGDYAPTMMEQLGELYNSQGMFGESIKVFRQLMALQPTSVKFCNWQTEVMRNTLSMTGSRATPETVKELQRLAAVYEKYKDQKGLKAEALEECRDNTANTLRELATVWHKEAQRTNNNDTYALAQYLYKEYIAKFPMQKDVYQMTFYYAELLYKLGMNGDNQKFCEAAPVYTDVVKMQPDPASKYLKESAYAAVIAWKNCLSVENSAEDAEKVRIEKNKEILANKSKNKGKKGEAASPEDEIPAEKKIPDNRLKMIEAFDTYIKYVPDSKELVNIKYQKARIYYEYNHLDEAAPFFLDIVDHHKDSELVVYSAQLYLDCLVIPKKYDAIAAILDPWLARPELTKDEGLKKRLEGIRASLDRKKIEVAEQSKDYKRTGQLYLQLAEKYPNDPKIDEVYYNAAINLERAKLIGQAVQARQALLAVVKEKKMESPLAKKAIYQIGRNFQDIGVFEKAADNYEKFATEFPGEFKKDGDPAWTPDAPTALYTASFYRRGLGDNDAAIKDTDHFVKTYGGRKEFVDRAAGVQFFTYEIYEQLKGQDGRDKVRKHFLDYLKNWATKGGVDRQIIAHVRLAELAWKESCPVEGVNGACIQLTRVRATSASKVAEKAQQKEKKKKKGKKKGADLPPTCGPATKSKIVVVERKANLVKEANAHFTEALKLFANGKAEKSVPGKDEAERGARINDMLYYAAEARMAQGDTEYEKFLSIKMPEKLDFSPAQSDFSAAKKKAQEKKVAESKKAFQTYMDTKAKSLAAAKKTYENVIVFKNAHWAIAATARVGQLYQDFSGQLFTAPVPKAPPAPQGYPQDEFEQMFHDAYCDQLVDAATPIEEKAVTALGLCLSKSTELSWFNEWSALCEGELNQIKPTEYPLAAEIRAEPGYSTVTTDQAVVQSLEN